MGTWSAAAFALVLGASTASNASATIKKSTHEMVASAECLTASVRAKAGLSKSSDSELVVMAARLEQAARALEKAVWDNRPPAQLAQYIKRTAGIHYEVVVLARESLDKPGAKALKHFGCEFRKTGEEFSDYAYVPFHGYQ